MSNLSVFKSDELEIIINTQTGESFCSVNGYARMSGKSKSTISGRVEKLVQSGEIKEDEVDTGYGFKVVRLIPAQLAFKWALKDNTSLAEQMGACGATVFFHNLAGYQVKSEAIQPQPQSLAETILMIAQQAVEQERRTKELEAKLAQIEATQQEAIASLDETAEPEVDAEELTTRAKLNRLVRDYSAANAIHFHEVWRRVYREFRDRYHVDLKQRAKNIQSNGGKKFTSLDVCEQLGRMEELYAVAFDLLKA